MANDPVMIDVAKQYDAYPTGRTAIDGDYNGERFRNEFLVPALNEAEKLHTHVVIDMDGVRTFGSSFLEEAFGGLIRNENFTLNKLEKLLQFRMTQIHLKIYREVISDILLEAEALRGKGPSKASK